MPSDEERENLASSLQEDCEETLADLYSSGCLFLVEGAGDEKAYQAVIDHAMGKRNSMISALSPEDAYCTSIDLFSDVLKQEYSVGPDFAKSLLRDKSFSDTHGCRAVASFLEHCGDRTNCFGIADRDFYVSDPRFIDCQKPPLVTDACDLESTVLSVKPSLLETALCGILGKSELDEACKVNVSKALFLAFEVGVVRNTEDSTSDNRNSDVHPVGIFYSDLKSMRYSEMYFDYKEGSFLLDPWIQKVVAEAEASNEKSREEFVPDLWLAALEDVLLDKGMITLKGNTHHLWEASAIQSRYLKGQAGTDEGRRQFWRFVNGHLLSFFVGKTVGDPRIKNDKEKTWYEKSLEDRLIESFSADSSALDSFAIETSVGQGIVTALRSVSLIN
jgi:hypothetical protein